MREIIKNYVGSCRMDMKCILTIPDEYNEHFDKKLYPAIVFLHGAGEQGSGLDDIKKAGGIVKQTIIKDVGHELCDIVFANEELYTWLLEQRKTSFCPSLVSVGG